MDNKPSQKGRGQGHMHCVLGGLFDRVDLIKPVSKVHLFMRMHVRPQNVS